MIIGLGEDLVAIDRIKQLIESKGARFLDKCFTKGEQDKAALHKQDERIHAYFAKRFAAKEACLKALGTGMRTGLSWHDMETGNDEWGRPVLTVTGGVENRLNSLLSADKQAKIHVTLSDEAGLAKATVILESL